MHLLMVGSVVVLSSCSGGSGGSSSKEAFANAFVEAHKAKDVEQIAGLFCWDDVDAETRTEVMGRLHELCDSSVDKVVFCPLSERIRRMAMETVTKNGQEYVDNIEPTDEFHINYRRELAGVWILPVGQKEGRYYFALPGRKGTRPAGPPTPPGQS